MSWNIDTLSISICVARCGSVTSRRKTIDVRSPDWGYGSTIGSPNCSPLDVASTPVNFIESGRYLENLQATTAYLSAKSREANMPSCSRTRADWDQLDDAIEQMRRPANAAAA